MGYSLVDPTTCAYSDAPTHQVLCESGRYIWLPIQFASRRGSTPLAGIAPISGNYRDSANLTVSWRDSWNLDDLVGPSIGSSVS